MAIPHPALSRNWLAAAVMTAAAAQALGAVGASDAVDARAYRLDGAQHLYAIHADRIYRGKLPPLIHAVVVVEVELDARGQVMETRLVRVPSHAPELALSICELIRQASPLPAPTRMGGVRYLETWLVDKSGRFQLDSLTEGQTGE